jgi:hypothetical protein
MTFALIAAAVIGYRVACAMQRANRVIDGARRLVGDTPE